MCKYCGFLVASLNIIFVICYSCWRRLPSIHTHNYIYIYIYGWTYLFSSFLTTYRHVELSKHAHNMFSAFWSTSNSFSHHDGCRRSLTATMPIRLWPHCEIYNIIQLAHRVTAISSLAPIDVVINLNLWYSNTFDKFPLGAFPVKSYWYVSHWISLGQVTGLN